MAVVLAAGLIFGTILTLGVVPALYAVLFRIDDDRLVQPQVAASTDP